MPTAFLSYSREDRERVNELELRLTSQRVTIWRDQEERRAGERWPKALGEAIAASDFLLLVWSKRAAESEFVELEWCTALALKKPVLPALLDDTPLPSSLASIQAVPLNEMEEAIKRTLTTLKRESGQTDEAQTRDVISRMAEIGAQEASEVLRQAKAIFAQNQLTVHGPVYQTTGDIHISTQQPAHSQKTMPEKWQVWVGLVVGVLTIIALLMKLVGTDDPATDRDKTPPHADAQISEQSLAGSIWDNIGEPLSGVKVSMLLGDQEVSTETDDLGRFDFRVTAPLEEEVTLIAQKEGYRTEKRYTHLGNSSFSFKMSRRER